MKEPSYRSNRAHLVLLAGFLGAGKTTLLRNILSWKPDMSDCAVIVNEFGDIGIDASLLEGDGSQIIELTTGCICCTLAIDLRIQLERLWERFSPRWIFLEASGVADPTAILSVLHEARIRAKIQEPRVVTVLDADCWEMRGIMGQLFYRQLESADVILLNKIDLVDTERVQAALEEIGRLMPCCLVMPTVHCRVDQETILFGFSADKPGAGKMGCKRISKRKRDRGGPDVKDRPFHAVEEGYTAFSFQDGRPMDAVALARFLDGLPSGILRIKGTVRLEDRTVMLHFVGGRWQWTDQPGASKTRLSFVGWKIDTSEILEALKRCTAL